MSAVHKWRVLDTTQVHGVNFFMYECKKCKVVTLNGMALAPHVKDKCEREACTGFGKPVKAYTLTGFH